MAYHFLRFILQVDPQTRPDSQLGTVEGWRVTITCPQKNSQVIGIERFLNRLGSGTSDFPIPPTAEPLPELLKDPFSPAIPSVDRLQEVFEGVNQRSAEGSALRLYGRYLFDTLVGPNWPEILAIATAEAITWAGDDLLVELALRWAVDQVELHRLHWEAMHDGQHFLATLSRDPGAQPPAAGAPVPVYLPLTITRLVPTEQSVPAPRSFPPPAKILFALGVPITNEQVRPAAEFIGLLRRLRLSDQEYSLYARLLENVSPTLLADASAEFQPNVIHFISHGNVERGKGPYLELAREEGQSEQEHKHLFGGDLVRQLGANLPVITVLSACYTAGQGERQGLMMSGATTAPMAAQLVAGNIPIVVGMSGQIADLACRLFTRGFGSALVRGEPLLLATAQGRWAAFAPGIPAENWVDWAFPAVFLADSVPVDFVPLDIHHDDTSRKINQWVADLKVGGQPVFCGRQDIFQDFYGLFSTQKKEAATGGKPILIIKVPDHKKGIGRYRMLVEMAIEAVRSGHLPLLIADEKDDWEPPTSPLELAKRLHDAIVILRTDVFHIGYEFWKRPRLRQVDLLYALRSNPKDLEKPENIEKLDDEVLQRSTGNGTEIPAAAVRAALQIEFAELLKDLREKHPDVIGPKSRVVILLNRVEDYQKALEILLINKNRWLGEFGLGDAPENGIVKEPVPVVMVYSYVSNTSKVNASNQLQSAFEEAVGNIGGVKIRGMSAFSSKTDEELLACYRVLLHPFKRFLNDGSELKPLIVNPMLTDQNSRNLITYNFHSILKGLPEMFWSEEFDQLVTDFWKEYHFLVEARDEDILVDLLKQQGQQLSVLRQAAQAGALKTAAPATPPAGGN